MKNKVFGDKLGTTIDKYALLVTLLFVGVFLNMNPDFLISSVITKIFSDTILCIACIMLICRGRKLEKAEILGVPEIAIGAFQCYLISGHLSHDGYLSFLYLFSVAFFLFNFIGGLIAFLYSWFRHTKKEKGDLLSGLESIVAIVTSLIGCALTIVQLFVQ